MIVKMRKVQLRKASDFVEFSSLGIGDCGFAEKCDWTEKRTPLWCADHKGSPTMRNFSLTLGQFRELTDEMPDTATLIINVNHGAAFVWDFRDVLDLDVTHMTHEPYGEVILDCAPPEG